MSRQSDKMLIWSVWREAGPKWISGDFYKVPVIPSTVQQILDGQVAEANSVVFQLKVGQFGGRPVRWISGRYGETEVIIEAEFQDMFPHHLPAAVSVKILEDRHGGWGGPPSPQIVHDDAEGSERYWREKSPEMVELLNAVLSAMTGGHLNAEDYERLRAAMVPFEGDG